MERLVCVSCGGPIAKSGETSYACLFCGTAFEIDANDPPAPRELLDRNSERWLDIARDKQRFEDAILRAADHEEWRRIWRRRIRTVLWWTLPFFALCALIAVLDRAAFAKDGGQVVPWLVIVALLLGSLAAFAGRQRRKRDAARNSAKAILGEALARYRSMSSQPATELLQWLCDPRRFGDGIAAELVAQMRGDLVAAAGTGRPWSA